MANIELSARYILTNGQLGSTTALASTGQNDSLVVEPLDSGDSQLWYFTESQLQGYYHMHTVGKGNFTSLDVYSYIGRPTIDLHFYATQDLTGQYWRFDKRSDGSFKVSNNFTGPDMYLDIQEGKAMLAARDSPSQHWTLSSLGSTPTSASSATSSSTSRATITPSNTTGAPTSSCTSQCTALSSSSSSKKLPAGGIAGIVVAAIVIIACLLVGAFIIRRNSKQKEEASRKPQKVVQNPVYHV